MFPIAVVSAGVRGSHAKRGSIPACPRKIMPSAPRGLQYPLAGYEEFRRL